jgi:ectoine hydroxylase-related dioxygenase (phytanoyl-CoA dioxygenase family)
MANIVIEILRRTKLSYTAYNIFHKKQLEHNVPVYKKLGINKSYYSPIGSHELSKIPEVEIPWLDFSDSEYVLSLNADFQKLPPKVQTSLLPWSKNGYMVLDSFFTEKEAGEILEEVNSLVKQGKANWRYNHSKIMFAVWESKKLRDLASPERLETILSLLMGKKVRLFQSINFYKGSQQASHSDSIHMTTFPLGFMIAVWIALEDIALESGPLSYFPGSHKLPYLLNKDIDNEGNEVFSGDKSYDVYEKELEQRLKKTSLEKKLFLAKKGDVLIWHANLIHGGEPILNPELTRKSMVMHYFCEDVVCYHEYTQRPALIRSF